jgi:hypothetical protein
MRMPRWWPVRQAKKDADQAEAELDKTHREVIEPLRRMRRGDFVIPAVAEDGRQRRQPGQ